MNGAQPSRFEDHPWLVAWLCLALAALTWLVFGQTGHFDFVNFDDNIYVLDNHTVAGGLSWPGVVRVCTHVECNFYHPLTMLSLMANRQFSDLHAGDYHLTNVGLHTASVLCLFLALRRLTGRAWRSAFVAAVFAVHPLHVESVAWVAERKDVLSGFFFTLILWVYAGYATQRRSWPRYVVLLVLFGLGLLCKTSLVTLPLVLLLLDYWPLRQVVDRASLRRLAVEKLPLLGVSAAACVMTVVAEGEAVSSTNPLSWWLKAGNPIVSYALYLWQTVYPARLIPFYPYPLAGLPGWQIAVSLAVLAAISLAALVNWRRRPYLLVGWFWYLGVLVPMIGIVQVGQFAHADRFTYLSQIGLVMLVVWLAAETAQEAGAGWGRKLLPGLAAVVLAVLAVGGARQTAWWQDSETLWRHTLAVAPDNFMAQANLGAALATRQQWDEAVGHYQRAIELNPQMVEAYYGLGAAQARQGREDAAVQSYLRALDCQPDYAPAHNNLGILLARRGRLADAREHLEKAVAADPEYAEARNNLGILLAGENQLDAARGQFEKAIVLQPDYADAWGNLGNVFAVQGQTGRAAEAYRQALRLNPANVVVAEQLKALPGKP